MGKGKNVSRGNGGGLMGALSTYEVIAGLIILGVIYIIAMFDELKEENNKLREHNRKLRKKLR